MQRPEIESLLDRYYQAFNALDPDAVAKLFDPDCEFVDLTLGREMHGLDALRDFVRLTAALSPGFQLTPGRILVDGDQASVSLTMAGTHAESGAKWSVPSSSVFRFRDGRIVYKADLWNAASVMEQIGMIEMPELEPPRPVPEPGDRPAQALAIARRLFGIEAFPEGDDGFVSPGLEHLFGEIWARPGLALRDRSLITVAALTVLAREQELRFHMRGALAAGVRPDEIREAILHLAYYGGYPVAAIARRAADDVLPGTGSA
ncbi:MAG: nuclear transport factor 2 family protein [Myxococcota bacterium]|nr:nuclear transport factor 2 family protein [Myxococcota bacterium]